MTVKYQFTRKIGDDMLNVTVEGEGSPEDLEADFAKAVTLAGLQAPYDGIASAVTQVTRPATVPPASVTIPAQPQAEQWGQPPVQPMAPAAAQKFCKGHNMPMVYKSGNTNGRDWAFWGCTATPDSARCGKEWA